MLPAGTPSRRHTLLIGTIGFFIGLAVAGAWFFDANLRTMQDEHHDAEDTSAPVVHQSSGGTLVLVSDQVAGEVVLVNEVEVTAPGVWVAVAETRNGEVANVLGAARVPGPSKHISVSLLRQTLPGQTYAIVLYRDDGDGVFDLYADSVYVDWNSGKRVVVLFKTTS